VTAFFEGRLEARVAELTAMNEQLSRDLRDVSVRLAAAETDRDDYEKRWLAECRAHGETRRKLETAEGFLPLARESKVGQ
jgi:hypothetical protein